MGFNKDGKQKIMESFNEKAIRMIKIFLWINKLKRHNCA
jgi:hypothetical protein